MAKNDGVALTEENEASEGKNAEKPEKPVESEGSGTDELDDVLAQLDE